MTRREISALAATISQLETRWQPYSSTVGSNDTYGYIAYPMAQFLEGLDLATKRLTQGKALPHRPSFLEVGCAWGTKMLVAAHLGWDVSGVEMVPEYVERAQELLPVWADQIHHGCAEDYEGYAGHKLIYMYRPFQGEVTMRKLVKYIRSAADEGTIMFTPQCPVPEDVEILDERLSLWVSRASS